MTEAPQPSQPPEPPQRQPPPPALPQPVLEYHQPLPRSAAFTSDAFFRFTGAFAVAFVAVMTLSSKAHPGHVVFLAMILTAPTGGVFALTCVLRRAFARRPWGREQSGIVTMAAGAGCAAGPTFVYIALIGRIETLPWIATAGLICCVLASFIAYPAVVED
jgi:hypothetical protein